MTDNFSSRGPADITAEACAWIAQLETGELTAADRDAFREWMGRSPRHAAEIKRLANISKDINVLSGMSESLHKAVRDHHAIVRPSRSRMRWPWACAASLLLVAMLFLQFGKTPPQPYLVSTAVGEYREIRLPDNSLAKLNTNSQLEVDYSGATRKVRLLSGEVFFDVQADSERPFLVYAGEQRVRVVGTAFVVSLLEQDLEVTVMHGKVELADAVSGSENNQPDAEPLAMLEAGQQMAVSDRHEVSPVIVLSKRELQRQLSWQEGLHDFSDTPLVEVVKELNRYSSMQIEIADPRLRELRFGGIFRTGETQALFDTLESSFGIEVEYLNQQRIRLSLAESQ